MIERGKQTKENTVSDKAEKSEASKILKQGQAEQFAGINARGISIDECPLVPVGAAIFIEWNVGNISDAIILDKEDQKKAMKPEKPYFTVIGIGATVKTVNVGDKIILRHDANIESYQTKDLEIKEMEDYKFHSIYEHAVTLIMK